MENKSAEDFVGKMTKKDIEIIESEFDPNASFSKTIEPGCCMWSDEYPLFGISKEARYLLLILMVIRERKNTNIEITEEMQKIWDLAKIKVKWPGFMRENFTEEQINIAKSNYEIDDI